MADTYVSTYTLLAVRQMVLSQLKLESAQESLLFPTKTTDLIHEAILIVRAMAGKVLNGFYTREATLTSWTPSSGLAVMALTSYNIADVGSVELFDATTLGRIPIIPISEFNKIRNYYAYTELPQNSAVAGIEYAAISSANSLVLKIYVNSSSANTTTGIVYLGVPNKQSTDASVVDIPDEFIPSVIDVAQKLIIEREDRKPQVGSSIFAGSK